MIVSISNLLFNINFKVFIYFRYQLYICYHFHMTDTVPQNTRMSDSSFSHENLTPHLPVYTRTSNKTQIHLLS